jgi:hypothetical protein
MSESTTTTTITADGRNGERYGALQSYLGRCPVGWLPERAPTLDVIEALVVEADALDPATWVGWSEIGSIVAEPRFIRGAA